MVKWAYSNEGSFVYRWRSLRMQHFKVLVQPPPSAKIIDLGGTEYLWTLFDHNYDLTIVNLPGNYEGRGLLRNVKLVEADACDLCDIFADYSFDIAFSNSVIEHVGGPKNEARFASEIKRLAPAFWVQTPSPRFLIEPHTGLPFYWQLPECVRKRLQNRWDVKMPDFGNMVAGTTYLTCATMQQLFPENNLYIERKFGFEKSYAVYKPYSM